MARYRNQRIWSNDQEFLKNLADEQENYIGRDYHLDIRRGVLTIFALPKHYKRKDKKNKAKAARNKRAESAARRS